MNTSCLEDISHMELQLQSLPLLFALFLFFLVLLKRAISKNSKPQDREPPQLPSPPGPWKLPIIGSIHHLVGCPAHIKLRDLTRVHGPLMLLQLGQIHVVVASSRDAAEEIMKTQDLKFASRPDMLFSRIIAYGLQDFGFAPYGDSWKQLRRIFVTELVTAKRVKSSSYIRTEEVYRFLKDISTERPRTPINIHRRVNFLIHQIVCRAAFGRKCMRQEELLPLMEDSLKSASGLSIADLFPSMRFLEVATGLRFKLERIHRQMDAIIDEIIEQHGDPVEDSAKEEDILDVLLRVKDQGGLQFPVTPTNIKAVIVDILLGGIVASASTIEWAMSEMIKNPRVMEKTRREIREAMRGKSKIENSDIEGFNYLRLVIKETLRLHPAGPLLVPRVCRETCKVLGYKISEGTRVFVNVWAIGRDSQYWEDPESFVPERFEDNAVDYKGTNFEFLPFGAGRRMCPGIGFGLASVEIALANMLFYFDWELPDGMKPEDLDMEDGISLSVAKKSALCLLAVPRFPLPVN